VGLMGHLIPFTREWMKVITPFFLLLVAGFLFYLCYRKNQLSFVLWFLVVFTNTFALEVIGVKTGLIFGSYYYGETLGLKILAVPLVIGFNWVFIISGALALAIKYFKNLILQVIFTAILVVAFDFILEPVAIYLDYWQWQDNIIPLRNYAGWFVITLINAFTYRLFRQKEHPIFLGYFFLIQFGFFAGLRLMLLF
jgi:putative membrane protein